MDVYILDDQFRRIEVVDIYESLVWTERYNEVGDFELIMRSDYFTRENFQPGVCLGINGSHRVMVIESIDDSINEEGRMIVKVSGRSLEKILHDRPGWPQLVEIENTKLWNYQPVDKPGDLMRRIFRQCCVLGQISAGDKLPFITSGSWLPTGTIPEWAVPEDIGFEPGSAYEHIKKVADIFDLGFRIVRELDTSRLYFDVYTGNDRTTLQTAHSPVVFSVDLDTMHGVNEIISNADVKNVAYVYGLKGTEVAYAPGADEFTSGFDRRVLVVDARDIELPPGTLLTQALLRRGWDELAKHRGVHAREGEIPKTDRTVIYGVDYTLGDIVEVRNRDNLTSHMRVTEQIFISDQEGVRSYPTLVMDLAITPGSWYSPETKHVWDTAPGTWDEA